MGRRGASRSPTSIKGLASLTNLKCQQNLKSRTIAVVVPSTTGWLRIQAAATMVVASIDRAAPGTSMEVAVP
jgi:hypothetical protein